MKLRRYRIKSRHALLELKSAKSHLGDLRPSADLEPEEFFELCRITEEIDNLIQRLVKMLGKGGEV